MNESEETLRLPVVTLKGNRTAAVRKDEKRTLHAMSPEQLKQRIVNSLKKYVEAKQKLSRSISNPKGLEKIIEKEKSTALLALDVLCKYVSTKEKPEDLFDCPYCKTAYQQFITLGIALDVVSTSISLQKWVAYREQFGLKSTTDLHLTGGTTIEQNLAFQKKRYEKNDFIVPPTPLPEVYGVVE